MGPRTALKAVRGIGNCCQGRAGLINKNLNIAATFRTRVVVVDVLLHDLECN
jgi:hypothetical protein